MHQKTVSLTNIQLNIKVGVKRQKKMDIDFYYEGNKINNSKIEDEIFLKRVEEGESFANGDKLKVNMEIIQEYDSKIDTYINKQYLIKEVIEHKTRSNLTTDSIFE